MKPKEPLPQISPQTLHVLFNCRSKEGRAREYLEKIEAKIKVNFPHFILNIIPLDAEGVWQQTLHEIVDVSDRHSDRLAASQDIYLVAAGGDGTVHALLNAVMSSPSAKKNLDHLYIGAIGLGSSNDFHKPLNTKIDGVPVRLNFAEALFWDIVQVNLIDKNNKERTVYFSISGSVGLVAEANAFFNGKDYLLTILKRYWTEGAIIYSALREIVFGHAIELQLNGKDFVENVSALCFLKTKFLSGSLKIDRSISHSDGEISFVMMENMGKIKLLKTLNELENNVFREGDCLKFFKEQSLKLNFKDEKNIELDGEIYKACSLELIILPGKIKVASNG